MMFFDVKIESSFQHWKNGTHPVSTGSVYHSSNTAWIARDIFTVEVVEDSFLFCPNDNRARIGMSIISEIMNLPAVFQDSFMETKIYNKK